jgi:Domain of unknown function (DUF4388)
MSEHREAVTNRLANVIRTIQLGARTGILTVERDTHIALEEGWIIFIHGRVTSARAGQFDNEAAFNWLKTWTTCRFAFVTSTPLKLAIPLSPQQSSSTTEVGDNTQPGFLLAPGSKKTRPLESDHENSTWEEQPTGPLPRVSPPYRLKRVDEGLSLIARLGLSRIHRHVFLLIDGHRTTGELAALVGRGPDELQTLLSELESAGLIHQ